MKDAFRKRARGKGAEPAGEHEVSEVASKPKGKGRGRGRKPKEGAAPSEPQPDVCKEDDTPQPDAHGPTENPSPNKRPSKSRKQAKEPADKDEASKALKDAWAKKD